MAFTGKKATRLILMAALLSAAAALPAEIRFEARYKKHPGTMTVDDQAIAFQGVKKDSWRWTYPDIDELKLGEHSVRVTAGRTYEFRGDVPAAVYAIWKDRLDQRFVVLRHRTQNLCAGHLARLGLGAPGNQNHETHRSLLAVDGGFYTHVERARPKSTRPHTFADRAAPWSDRSGVQGRFTNLR